MESKTKIVKNLQLKATACELVDENTQKKVEFIKYQLILDDAVIGIGANDKFKELLKYLTGANSLQVGESIVLGVK